MRANARTSGAVSGSVHRKGIGLIFPNTVMDFGIPFWGAQGGNATELGDGSGKPGKSYLFFLTAFYPGIGLTGDRVPRLGKHLMSEVSGAFLTPLENPRERFIRTPGRTHNRIRSPR